MRPKQETALTLDERFPVVVVGELLKGGKDMWEEIENVAKKEREERCVDAFRLLLAAFTEANRWNLSCTDTSHVDNVPNQLTLDLLARTWE